MARERKSLSDAVMKRFVADPNSVQAGHASMSVALTAIKLPTKRQPRRYFNPEKMAQLAASVRVYGILEPILVRPLKDGNYELIAGERRLRAAQEVGLTQIPVVSHEVSDQEALKIALMENLQRDDLNPIEETEAILELLAIALQTNIEQVKSLIYRAANAKNRGQVLKEDTSLQIEKIESYLGELGRFNLESFRSSRLPLLNLPPKILDVLRQGKLEYSKARTIAQVKDDKQRNELLKQAIAKGLSLNQIRERVQASKADLDPEMMPQQVLFSRMSEIAKQLKRSKAWTNRRKCDRITKLLDELERLTSED